MGRKQSPILNQNKLKLGIFSSNCSGGMSVTKLPERWVNSCENNIRLAKLADDACSEFLLQLHGGSGAAERPIFTAACSKLSSGQPVYSRIPSG
jgi:hypothetical protein